MRKLLALMIGLLMVVPLISQRVIHRDTKVSAPIVAPSQDIHDVYQPLTVTDETDFGLEKLRTDSRTIVRNGMEYCLPGVWKPIDKFRPGAYANAYLDLVHERDSFRHLSNYLMAQSLPLSEALHDLDSIKRANDSLQATIANPTMIPVVPDGKNSEVNTPPISTGAILFIGGMAVIWLLAPAFQHTPPIG
jgi:hypothetical protein